MTDKAWLAQLHTLAQRQSRLRPERVLMLYVLSPLGVTLLLSLSCGTGLLRCWLTASVFALLLGGLPALLTGLMALLLRKLLGHGWRWVVGTGVVGYVSSTLAFGLYDVPMRLSLKPNELSWLGAVMAVLVSLLIMALERRLRRRQAEHAKHDGASQG